MKVQNVRDHVPRFTAYLRKNLAWGSLHVVLDDGNVDDTSVQTCVKWAKDAGDHEGLALAEILSNMSRTQRLKLSDLCYRELSRP